MIQPNADCNAFCYWLLNISAQRLSGPQRVIVNAVQAAGIGVYPVSQQTWYNFNLFTAWRYPYYLVYANLATVSNPDLNTGLVYAWDFEGNSNTIVGANNGVDTLINYGLPYGKILQGAEFPAGTSHIALTPFFTGTTFSINVWINLAANANAYNEILGDGGVNYGLYYLPATGKFAYLDGAAVYSNAFNPFGAWTMVTFVSTGAASLMYINGNDETDTSAAIVSRALSTFGVGIANFNILGYLDAPAFWSRALSYDEVQMLWNSGAGVQAPY